MFKGKIERVKITKKPAKENNKDFSSNTSQSQGGFEEVQLIPTAKFTETLVQLKIVKSEKPNVKLQEILKFNEQNKDMIMLKKLSKIIEVLINNAYMLSFGLKKKTFSVTAEPFVSDKALVTNKAQVEEDDEYYDEEEENDEKTKQ